MGCETTSKWHNIHVYEFFKRGVNDRNRKIFK